MNKDEKFRGNQVLTDRDKYAAICGYIALQLRGRFIVEFPENSELCENMAGQFADPDFQSTEQRMLEGFMEAASEFTAILTVCKIRGCPDEDNHKFVREFVNLLWDAREQTGEWLKGQGIVPGQSAN